jgi:hypothetical protein
MNYMLLKIETIELATELLVSILDGHNGFSPWAGCRHYSTREGYDAGVADRKEYYDRIDAIIDSQINELKKLYKLAPRYVELAAKKLPIGSGLWKEITSN